MRTGLGLALAILCSFVAVEGAVAGTVSLGLDRSSGAARHAIVYDAHAGERNEVRLWGDFTYDFATGQTVYRALVSDTAGMTVGEGCVPVEGSTQLAACDTTELGLWLFDIQVRDGDDRVTVEKAGPYGARLAGGDGDDTLLSGIHGSTVFIGGSGNDTMTGKDTTYAVFDEGNRSNGSDVMSGGAWVDYSARRQSVIADPTGSRDDGERGERDTIAGVLGLVGGHAADWLEGGPGADSLLGGPGRDTIGGGAGDDYLDAEWPGRAIQASSRRAHDQLSGGPGRDFLQAGPGGNVLRGGDGPDLLAGDDGDDRIASRDGLPDEVRCAGGRDRLRQDELDFHRGCERRWRQSGAPVPLMAIASAGKFGDRYVYVRLGCPAKKRGARCAGTVQLEVDGAVQSAKAFDRPWALNAVTFTEASAFPQLPFGDVWALMRENSRRTTVSISSAGGGTTRVPVPSLPKSFLNPPYLLEEVADHVGPRPYR